MMLTQPRVSRLFTLISFNEFGNIDNPIWHLEVHPQVIEKDQLTSQFIEQQEGQILLPLESVKEAGTEFLESLTQTSRQRLVLQMGLCQLESLEKFETLDIPIQIWIDREINERQLSRLQELQGHIELVLTPFRLLNLHNLYKKIGGLDQIPCSFLFIPKLNPFSGLWDLKNLFPLYIELSLLVPNRRLGAISLFNFWPSLTPVVQNFLIYPTESNYSQLLKTQSPFQYGSHKLVQSLLPNFLLGFGILLLKTLRQPQYFIIWIDGESQRWRGEWGRFGGNVWRWSIMGYWFVRNNSCRIRDFTVQVLLFPFFKIYWFIKFQIEKRIFKLRK